MNIYIRTNFSNFTGLGHLMRCTRLAKEFEYKGHKCFFFLDRPNNLIKLKYKNFFIYNNSTKYSNEINDARLFCKLTAKNGPGIVLLDDYRFSEKWERYVSKIHKKIVIFDDLENCNHYADVIINYNPKHYPIVKYNFKKNKKKNCKYLIGPKYNVLDKKKIKKKANTNFNITFYIGGGSNQIIIFNVLTELLKIIKNKKIKFLIILGPLTKNKKKIIELSKKNKSVELVSSYSNIYNYIQNSQLFVGTAGTAIFETSLFKTPSILIKMTENQDTDEFSLEKLGHFFYLSLRDLFNTKKISRLIFLIFKNYSRFKILSKNPEIEIDDKGTRSIVNSVFSKNKIIKNIKVRNKFYAKTGLEIRPVKDNDINHYLFSRNLNINVKKSTNLKLINKLDHYIWWLTTNRKSYVLLKNKKKMLYLYDENFFYKKKYFFTLSGWFACSEKCTIKEILFALNWQRNKANKNIKWISFIKKTNKFSIKLSKYIGWKIIKDQDKSLNKIKDLLNIKKNNFIFYKR